MSKKFTWKKVSQAEFDQIKAMQNADISRTQVRKLTGRSYTVTSNIYRVKTLADYRALGQAQKQAKLERRIATEIIPEIAPETVVKPTAKVAAKGQQEKEALERIATALENLVDAWNNSPKRRIF